jgi:hypothetical protein
MVISSDRPKDASLYRAWWDFQGPPPEQAEIETVTSNNLALMKIKWLTGSAYKKHIDRMIGLVSELVAVARDSEVVSSYCSRVALANVR